MHGEIFSKFDWYMHVFSKILLVQCMEPFFMSPCCRCHLAPCSPLLLPPTSLQKVRYAGSYFPECNAHSLDGRLFITFFPGSLVHHSRIKLHQDKYLNHIFEKYSKYCKPTLSEEKRLKSGGGFVITYLFSDDSCWFWLQAFSWILTKSTSQENSKPW